MHEDLKAYIDGELDSARTAEIERALADSPELQKEMEMLKKIGESFSAYSGGPAQGKAALMDKLQQSGGSNPDPEPPRSRWSWRPSKLALAAFASIAGLALFTAIAPTFGRSVSAPATSVAMEASSAEIAKSSMESADMASPPNAAPEPAASPSASASPQRDREGSSAGFKAEARAESPAVRSGVNLPGGATEVETLRPDRDIVQSAQLGVEVKNAQDALQQTELITRGLDGYLENKTFETRPNEGPQATAMMKVPVDKFDRAMESVRKLGKVVSENQQADDITKQTTARIAEIAQLQRKIENVKKELRTAKGWRKDELNYRLNDLLGQQNSHKTTLKQMDAQAAISTIWVTFTESEFAAKADADWSNRAWDDASTNFGRVARFLGALGINLLIFSPIWLPILGFFWWTGRKKSA